MSSPYLSEWTVFNEETGGDIVKSLSPEDVVECLHRGMSSYDIAREFEAPLSAVENAVMLIPYMVCWRDEQQGQQNSDGLMKLPRKEVTGT